MIIAGNTILDTYSVIIAWLALADLFTVWQSYTAVLIASLFTLPTILATQNIALQLQPALLRYTDDAFVYLQIGYIGQLSKRILVGDRCLPKTYHFHRVCGNNQQFIISCTECCTVVLILFFLWGVGWDRVCVCVF